MQFPNMDDEDGDFGNTTRSRLSSLFQTERTSGDVNQALTFTAPKQPKKNDNPQSSQETLKLIHASAVHAYKLIDGNYTNQGKLGCAILGLHETSNYKLLLYKGKQAQVSTTNILSSFKFHVQPNNYATFYDEKNENWSINFDSESALLNFAKQVAITKANAQDKNQPTLIIQDLVQGEGPSVEIGDSAEVKYTGWLLFNYTFGQIFDTNMQSESAFRLRLGKKVIKGWSEGLVGAQKGTKRLLVVPPNLAYGAKGMGSAVPPKSTLIFEIAVTKVKVSREASHSPSPLKTTENVTEKKPEVLPRHSITSEDNIRLRGASISEQLSQSPKKDKAQLISRMAKMGTATLPFHGAIPAQASSDSENEEETRPEKSSPPVQLSGSRTSSPKPPSKPTSRKNSELVSYMEPVQLQPVQESNQFHMSQQPSSISFYSQQIMPNQQPYGTPTNAYPTFQPPITPQYQMPQIPYGPHNIPGVVPHVTSVADTHLPMLITESRSQNTEVRLSLSKITEKVDTVIQKVDDLRVNQGRSGAISHSSFMDTTLLIQSIEKIVQENSQLKEDVEIKSGKIQSLNEKICDLLQRNQRFFEESNNMLEQRSESLQATSVESQAKLFSLEKEKAKLSSDLSNTLHKLASIETEVENYQSQESKLKQRLQGEKRRIEELELELNTLKKICDSESESSSLVNSLKSEIKDLCDTRTILNNELRDWEEKYNTLNKAFSEKTEEFQELLEQVEKNNTESKNSTNSEDKEKIETLKKEIKSIRTEKNEVFSKCQDLQTKLSESIKSESLLKKKVSSLQSELQNALPWKEKYEIFYHKTRQMKDNYENERQKLMVELKQAQSTTSSTDFSGEIKRTMNVLYKLLQGKFELNSSYTGTQVLETTLQAIRGLTLQMLQKKGQRSDTMKKDSDPATSVETPALNSIVNVSEIKHRERDQVSSDNNVAEIVKENNVEENLQENNVEENNVEQNLQENNVERNSSSDVLSAPDRQTSLTHSTEEINPLENHVSSDSEQIENKLNVDSAESSDCNNQTLQKDTVIDSQILREESVEKKDELKSSKDSTEKSTVDSQTRDSPDQTQQLSPTNISDHSLFETDASKIWKPQPPPLFDDDDDDDDDYNDWLK